MFKSQTDSALCYGASAFEMNVKIEPGLNLVLDESRFFDALEA